MNHNGSGISDVADFLHQSPYEAPQFNLKQMFNRSTSAHIANTMLAVRASKIKKNEIIKKRKNRNIPRN